MNPPGRSDGDDSGSPLSQAPTRPAGTSRRPLSTGDVSSPLLAPGATFGPYLVHRLFGRGGMGEVYEAEHLETGRRVALKVLSRALAETTDRARFLREGRLAAAISHPHSVYVFGTEEIEGTPVIAMELVVGGTLKDRLAREGPLPPAEAVDAILQVISGLEAAAEKGVLHRDVKPSNCFAETDGTIKVGDFGLSMTTSAREGTQLTLTGAFLGTPSFASPEQLRGEPLDVRADISSVGATLYCLLTGRAPFEDGGVMQLLAAVLERAPRDPRTLRPEVPRGLARIVLRCLEKHRTARYGGYEELRADLLPFGSAAPSPASLGLRVVAGAIDGVVVTAIFFAGATVVMGANWFGLPLRDRVIQSLPLNALTLLYYALLEGTWGAAAGKAVFRLRVVGPDRGAAGFARALLRASIYSLLPLTPWLVWAALDPATTLPAAESRHQWAEPALGFLGEALALLSHGEEGERCFRPACQA